MMTPLAWDSILNKKAVHFCPTHIEHESTAFSSGVRSDSFLLDYVKGIMSNYFLGYDLEQRVAALQ